MAWDLAILVYFVTLNTIYLIFTLIAYAELRRHRRRWTSRRLEAVMRSAATPAISVIAPAYNEEATIRESLRSLLLLHYPHFEVIVVNDGSKDRTLEELVAGFELLQAPGGYEQPVATQPVRGVYRSLANPNLVVIDKTNGGKADAINAGINVARHPLVCVIDADSLLEDDALMRAAIPFIEDPTTLAAGGIVRIANGCTVESGRVLSVGLPASWLARFQVVEYLRAFLAGRLAQSAMNGLLIISGAFGMFRRDAVVEVGGFRHDTIGEDMEIVMRLHRWARDAGRPYRIVFQPDPVCWTEVPEDRRILRSQRNRWQRGTLQVLSYHRAMMGGTAPPQHAPDELILIARDYGTAAADLTGIPAFAGNAEWKDVKPAPIMDPTTGTSYPGFIATSVAQAKLTFASRPGTFDGETATADRAFHQFSAYRGIAVHDYDGFRALRGGPQ